MFFPALTLLIGQQTGHLAVIIPKASSADIQPRLSQAWNNLRKRRPLKWKLKEYTFIM